MTCLRRHNWTGLFRRTGKSGAAKIVIGPTCNRRSLSPLSRALSCTSSFLHPSTDNRHSLAMNTLCRLVKFNFVSLEHGRMYKAMLDSFALRVIFI